MYNTLFIYSCMYVSIYTNMQNTVYLLTYTKHYLYIDICVNMYKYMKHYVSVDIYVYWNSILHISQGMENMWNSVYILMWCQYIHIYHDIVNASFYKVWVLYETLFPCTYINSVSHIFQSMVNVQNMSIYIPKISQCSVHTHTCAIHCASSTLTLHGLMMRACAHIKTVVSVCACRHTYLTIFSEHTAISVHLFLMTLQVTDNVQVQSVVEYSTCQSGAVCGFQWGISRPLPQCRPHCGGYIFWVAKPTISFQIPRCFNAGPQEIFMDVLHGVRVMGQVGRA